jgi:phosphohistidine phosphatase
LPPDREADTLLVPMWVHAFRHGIAIDPTDPACPTDPERFLTDKGKARTRAGARGLEAIGIKPDLIVTSPYVRARQTAEILREELEPDALLVESDTLTPMADPTKIVELLRERAEQNVMCVGHAPHLDLFVAYLAGTDDPVTSLKKAGCASLEVRTGRPGAGTGQLVGVYPASVLRKLGGADD